MTEVNASKVYVGNLPFRVGFQELRELFSSFGEITDAVVIADPVRRRSKGFGFVTFSDEACAQKAVKAMNGKEIDGRALNVNIARPPETKQDSSEAAQPPTQQEKQAA